MTRAADGQAKALKFGYNNQGLVTGVSNAYGRVESVVFDALNRPIQVTDANNVSVTNQFDLLNRITARSWPDGISEGFRWATNGLAAYTNRNQKVTWFARDLAGRLTYVTNANQEVTRLGYNSLGQVTDLWDGRRTNHTSWGFNEYGWLMNKVDALGHEVLRYTRDPNGQVTNRWTPQFGNTGFAYDEVGNLKAINYSLSSISYAYDALSRLKTMVDDSGTSTFGYTAAGQLQSEQCPWANDTLTYGYTEGLRTNLSLSSLNFGYDYDSAWRLHTLSSPAGTFTYGYGAPSPGSALVDTITLPNAAWITNHYDSLARLDYTALANRWGHVLDGYAYTHDALGLRTNITRSLGLTNSNVTVGYDSIGQLTSWKAREGLSGPLRLNEQFDYLYDQAGNLRYRTNSGLIQTFSCDGLNQLTNVSRNNSMTVSGATPAPAASVTVNGVSAQRYGDFTFAATNLSLVNGANTFTIIAQNAYGLRVTNTTICNLPSSVSLAWDANGNLTNDGTRAFAYSPENRLTNVTVAGAWKTDFVFDGLGRRRVELDYGWQSGNWTKTNELHFVYDGPLLIQIRDGNNNVVCTYTRGPDLSGSLSEAGGIGGLLARTDSTGSTFYHADGAGNITGLMDGQQNMAARYMYTAFGNLTLRWGPMGGVNRIMFSSKEHLSNAEDIYDFGRRDWFTSPHRWLTRDPIGEAGGINLYGFVGNNPIGRIDPFGLAANVVSGPNGPVGPSSLDAPGGARYVPGSLPPLPLPGYLFGGVVVGMAGAAAVTIGAPLAVSGLTLAGMSTTAAGATVTTGLGALGTAGALASGYDIYNNACKKNWNGIAFDLGTLGGGALVGVAGGGRALAGLSDSPSSVSPGAGLFGDTYLHYDPNYPGGSFLGWLGSAPTPQSGGAVLTFTAGGAGFLFSHRLHREGNDCRDFNYTSCADWREPV